MKRIIKISSGTLLSFVILFTGCKKKDEDIMPNVVPASSKFNTTSFDSTAMVVIHDTVYAPAQDKGSRTFFNSQTLSVLTANQINANLNLSDGVIFGYFFSSDTSGAVFANTYAYFDTSLTSGWHKTATIFRKNVPLSDYKSAANSNDIINAWNAATPYTGPNSGGFIYKIAVDQVYAFTTQTGKVGLIRIISMIPGNNPYADYVLFEIKMQK